MPKVPRFAELAAYRIASFERYRVQRRREILQAWFEGHITTAEMTEIMVEQSTMRTTESE